MKPPAARTVKPTDVAIIGAGPAGLAAATRLAATHGRRVLVLEREATPGGIPRHCNHPGYGMRDMRTFISGPAYAQRLVREARGAGAEILTEAMVTAINPDNSVDATTPAGLLRVQPRRSHHGHRRAGTSTPGAADSRRPTDRRLHDRAAPERRAPAPRHGRQACGRRRRRVGQLVSGDDAAPRRMLHRALSS